MFETKKKKVKLDDHKLVIPSNIIFTTSKEVAKIREMLKQVEFWINLGEEELAKKHWMLISDECRKHGI